MRNAQRAGLAFEWSLKPNLPSVTIALDLELNRASVSVNVDVEDAHDDAPLSLPTRTDGRNESGESGGKSLTVHTLGQDDEPQGPCVGRIRSPSSFVANRRQGCYGWRVEFNFG